MAKQQAQTTTTKTTQPVKFMYLNDYLDYVGGLDSGERLYYTKHFGKDKTQKTAAEWESLTQLKKK